MVREVAAGIYRIDVNHPVAETTCCYLITADNDHAALIDCGGGRRGEAAVLAGLKTLNIATTAIRLFIATHAHLDHAGAAGLLMQHFSQAVFYAHPSAIKHLQNPDATLASASLALFGSKFYNAHYDGLIPIPIERSHAVKDNERIMLAERPLQVIFTPGHAWHHLSIYDKATSFVVAGDAYGISYRQLDCNNKSLLVPVTPPSQFNPQALKDSVMRIYNLKPTTIGLSHFDVIDTATHGDLYLTMQQEAMTEWMVFAEELFAQNPQLFKQNMQKYLLDWTVKRAVIHGAHKDTARRLHQNDAWLTSLGFEHYLKNIAAKILQ